MTLIRVVKVFLRRFRDPIRVLQIGSLASEKIIIGSLKSENIGSLESEKSGPYRSKPLSNEIFDLTPCTPCTLHRVIFYTPNTRAVVVSRDRNLRDRDRNLVKISGWDRDWDFIKNSDTETWSSRPRLETSKLVHFAEIFLKNIAITSKSFFLFLAFSQHVLVVSYLKIQITKNSWNREILRSHCFAIFKVSKLETFETETETWNLQDQNSQKWISRLVTRPRPSLETPSLANTLIKLIIRALGIRVYVRGGTGSGVLESTPAGFCILFRNRIPRGSHKIGKNWTRKGVTFQFRQWQESVWSFLKQKHG